MSRPEGSALSLCMIVRNEAELLPRCLQSVQGVVDEIVVVDTGSTDETPAIAERFGARVQAFPWIDDFAAARNAGLELATGDWILVLDADEVLLPGAAGALREAMAGSHGAYLLTLENLLGDGSSTQSLNLLRLFRRDPRVRFCGRVHEQVTASLEELGWSIGYAAARIRHDGYLATRIERHDKHARNLKLLDAMCAETPDNPYAWYQLGKTHLAMEALMAARRAFETALRLVAGDPHPERYAFHATTYLHLASITQQETGVHAALPLLHEAVRRLPNAAELWHRIGLLEREAGRPEEALAAFERCLELADAQVSGVDARRLVTQAATQAGELLLAHGPMTEALACFQLAAERAPSEAYQPWLRLAVTWMQAGDLARARNAYEAVVVREPNEASAQLALGTLYFEAGDYARAIVALNVVDALRPGSADVAFLLDECRRLGAVSG